VTSSFYHTPNIHCSNDPPFGTLAPTRMFAKHPRKGPKEDNVPARSSQSTEHLHAKWDLA